MASLLSRPVCMWWARTAGYCARERNSTMQQCTLMLCKWTSQCARSRELWLAVQVARVAPCRPLTLGMSHVMRRCTPVTCRDLLPGMLGVMHHSPVAASRSAGAAVCLQHPQSFQGTLPGSVGALRGGVMQHPSGEELQDPSQPCGGAGERGCPGGCGCHGRLEPHSSSGAEWSASRQCGAHGGQLCHWLASHLYR